MALTPGTRLAVYEVIAQIGAGGMGEVYRARDTKLNREVAIKVLPESFALDADRVARFASEGSELSLGSLTRIFKNRLSVRAGLTGLEPATSAVTVRHSNQAELQPRRLHKLRNEQRHDDTATHAALLSVPPRGFEPRSLR